MTLLMSYPLTALIRGSKANISESSKVLVFTMPHILTLLFSFELPHRLTNSCESSQLWYRWIVCGFTPFQPFYGIEGVQEILSFPFSMVSVLFGTHIYSESYHNVRICFRIFFNNITTIFLVIARKVNEISCFLAVAMKIPFFLPQESSCDEGLIYAHNTFCSSLMNCIFRNWTHTIQLTVLDEFVQNRIHLSIVWYVKVSHHHLHLLKMTVTVCNTLIVTASFWLDSRNALLLFEWWLLLLTCESLYIVHTVSSNSESPDSDIKLQIQPKKLINQALGQLSSMGSLWIYFP